MIKTSILFKIFMVSSLLLNIQCSKRVDVSKTNEIKLTNEQFIQKTFKLFEIVSSFYPEGSVSLKIEKNSEGNLIATFAKTNLEMKPVSNVKYFSKLNSNFKVFYIQYELEEAEGVDCDGSWSCGKKIQACLEKGCEATIRNGTCASYCVTCKCK